MSEQRINYMQQLDSWSDANVVAPLVTVPDEGEELTEEAVEHVKKAIRTKVLESFRNGQAAGPTKPHSFKPRG
jgi:hypothetical protein